MVNVMIIRLGYVAISKTLEGVSSSSNITYSKFSKESDYKLLSRVIVSNLEDLIKILNYNKKNKIHFYRMTSNLIPLATHEKVSFDYLDKYKIYYQKIGNIINGSGMRVDMHPSCYCIINSTRSEVVNQSVNILKYHYDLMDAIGIDDKVIIVHVGGNTFGKKNSLSRFINNFKTLPKYIQECIVIENDDKVFNIEDCLYLAKILDIPVVLDYHHFLCNKTDRDIDFYLEEILGTWKDKRPKIHFSSPRNKKDFRSHHDYINVDDFIIFLSKLQSINRDVDIMIEAKAKDEAMFRLIRELKYKTNYKFIDETSFEL